MLKISKKSDKSTKELISLAETHFGPGGLGLAVRSIDPCCASFEGGGGFVNLQVSETDDSASVVVDIETREWEYAVKKFLREQI